MEIKKIMNLERGRDFLSEMRSYVVAFVTTYLTGLLSNGSTKSTIASRSTTKVSGNSFAVEMDKNGKLSVNIANASTSAAGLMAAADKTDLSAKTQRVYVGDGLQVATPSSMDGAAQVEGSGLGTDTSTKETYIKQFGRLMLALKSTDKDGSAAGNPATSGGLLIPLKVDSAGILSSRIPNATTSASGLMTKDEKSKLSGIAAGAQPGTVTKVSTGAGLTGGDITTSGTVKANLVSETALSGTALTVERETGANLIGVRVDSSGRLCIVGNLATTSQPGLMSATDKSAVDSMYSWLGSHQVLSGFSDYQALLNLINEKVSTLYKPKGSIAGTGLVQSLLDASEEGDVYNVTDDFSSSNLFVEGTDKSFPAGTNVVVVKVGEVKKFDVLAGFIDLDPYQLSADLSVATKTEIRDLFNTNATAASGSSSALGTADATAILAGQTLPILQPVVVPTSEHSL